MESLKILAKSEAKKAIARRNCKHDFSIPYGRTLDCFGKGTTGKLCSKCGLLKLN